jgi:hypothetical protein
MNKEIIDFLEKKGLLAESFDDAKEICIDINATGKRKEVEEIAKSLDIKVEESNTQYMTALDYISLIGSTITILDFLLKMKRLYGKTLMVSIKSVITGDMIEEPVDEAIEDIISQNEDE